MNNDSTSAVPESSSIPPITLSTSSLTTPPPHHITKCNQAENIGDKKTDQEYHKVLTDTVELVTLLEGAGLGGDPVIGHRGFFYWWNFVGIRGWVGRNGGLASDLIEIFVERVSDG